MGCLHALVQAPVQHLGHAMHHVVHFASHHAPHRALCCTPCHAQTTPRSVPCVTHRAQCIAHRARCIAHHAPPCRAPNRAPHRILCHASCILHCAPAPRKAPCPTPCPMACGVHRASLHPTRASCTVDLALHVVPHTPVRRKPSVRGPPCAVTASSAPLLCADPPDKGFLATMGPRRWLLCAARGETPTLA